tara:strand:+ start:329 stop:460 length:132 start_codon:yes stop_codon:yes gene_type:complete
MFPKSQEISAILQADGTWFVQIAGLGVIRKHATFAEVLHIFLG